MRKIVLLLLAVVLLCLPACAKAPETPAPTEAPKVTLPPEQTPRTLEWNPYKAPYALNALFGEGSEDDFKAAVQALTERRSTSPLTCEAFGEAFAENGELLYPPLAAIAHIRCDGDRLHFNYRLSESEQKWLQEDFKARLAALAEVVSVESDTPDEAARALYDYMTSSFTPDPAASASPLTALMEGTGNDAAFAAAYAYVATQLGVETLPEIEVP